MRLRRGPRCAASLESFFFPFCLFIWLKNTLQPIVSKRRPHTSPPFAFSSALIGRCANQFPPIGYCLVINSYLLGNCPPTVCVMLGVVSFTDHTQGAAFKPGCPAGEQADAGAGFLSKRRGKKKNNNKT